MGPCRIGWSCSFAVLCCDSNLPCLTCCLAGVPLLLSDLVWNRSIENTDSWKKKHQDENWVSSFWEQQKVKKFREQGREVFIRCFLSHGRWLKSMWRTLALPRTIFLNIFCLCFPGERERKQLATLLCTQIPQSHTRIWPSSEHNPWDSEDLIYSPV